MSEAYINEHRQARLFAEDFLAANPRTDRVSISHGGVRVTLDRSGNEHVDRVCTGCAHDIPGSCAASTRDEAGYLEWPEEPCYQAKEAA